MLLGFARSDITPRVGVELCGFGPFLHRYSTSVRDRLWARAMAMEVDGQRAVVIACDLISVTIDLTRQVRQQVAAATGADDEVMIACSHTHSGPATARYIGWGEPDPPYMETLPRRIADAAIAALGSLHPATLSHAEVPCEGIGLNREYDCDAPPLDDVLREDWRPTKPQLTDTTCHVLVARSSQGDDAGAIIGFASYFGCHPVVCCQWNHQIHGDFVGLATNMIERELIASKAGAPATPVGLFLQGAQGDVNSCVVHKGEAESLLALEVIAARYARSVRTGIAVAKPIAIDRLRTARHLLPITRKPWGIKKLRQLLEEKEAIVHASGRRDDSSWEKGNLRMETVYLLSIRHMLAQAEAGRSLSTPFELHGIRLGPIELLGTPFEVMQAIKNDVKAIARAPIPLVMGLVNDSGGYATDRTVAARGGYAAAMVPLIGGLLPFAKIHDELVAALLDVDRILA